LKKGLSTIRKIEKNFKIEFVFGKINEFRYGRGMWRAAFAALW
jgi:hypothetical protein